MGDVVELDRAGYSYGAVHEVSLRVGAGEVLAMLGPNGAVHGAGVVGLPPLGPAASVGWPA